MSKSNSVGQQYAQVRNTWNADKFMAEYAQVNNQYFPFVHGNPFEWGSALNANPFFWGQPQAPRYCACGQSLKISQAEGFCGNCAVGSSQSQAQPEGVGGSSVSVSTAAPPPLNYNLGGVRKQLAPPTTTASASTLTSPAFQMKAARDQRAALAAAKGFVIERDDFGSYPYGTSRQYGTGAIGNGTIAGAPVVPASYYDERDRGHQQSANIVQHPHEGFELGDQQQKPSCNTAAMIGQHPPLEITGAGGIQYMYDSPALQAATWDNATRKSFCAATQGGKRLAF